LDTNFKTEGNWYLEITLNVILDADPKINYLGYNAEEVIRVPLNLSSEFRKDYVAEMGEALYHLLTYEYILPFSKILGVAPKGATVAVSFPHLVLSCNSSNAERRKILSRAVV
jgi:hypothetical protein